MDVCELQLVDTNVRYDLLYNNIMPKNSYLSNCSWRKLVVERNTATSTLDKTINMIGFISYGAVCVRWAIYYVNA
jgi:hypothetical protein